MATATGDSRRVLLRQLFEKESSTYTYLLADLGHPDKPAVVRDQYNADYVSFSLVPFFFPCFSISQWNVYFNCLNLQCLFDQI